jgi:hypothetical protein
MSIRTFLLRVILVPALTVAAASVSVTASAADFHRDHGFGRGYDGYRGEGMGDHGRRDFGGWGRDDGHRWGRDDHGGRDDRFHDGRGFGGYGGGYPHMGGPRA